MSIFGDLMTLVPLATGAGAQVGAAQNRDSARRRAEDFYRPGRLTGTIGPDENIDFSVLGDEFADPAVQARAHAVFERVPGGYDQSVADQRFKDKYLPQYRQQMEDFENGPSGRANRRVGEIIAAGGQAIDQGTLNKMVAQFIDQNRGAATSNYSAIDADIAARGLSPEAAYEARANAAFQEQGQNATDTRDVTVKAALANKDYERQILELGQRIGDQYAARRAALLNQIAGLDAPFDFAGAGAAAGAFDTAAYQDMQAIDLGDAAALTNLANSMYDLSGSNQDRRAQMQMARDANATKWTDFLNPAANVASGALIGHGYASK